MVGFRDNWILHACNSQLASEYSHLTGTLRLGIRGHTAGLVLKSEHTVLAKVSICGSQLYFGALMAVLTADIHVYDKACQ